MNYLPYFKKLADIKHVVVATNNQPSPAVAFIDVMDVNESGIYFMTSKNGRNLYSMLNDNDHVSLIAKSEGDFFHSKMFQIQGTIKNIGKEKVNELLDKNIYLKKLYPDYDLQKRQIIDVFKVEHGNVAYQDFATGEKVNFTF